MFKKLKSRGGVRHGRSLPWKTGWQHPVISSRPWQRKNTSLRPWQGGVTSPESVFSLSRPWQKWCLAIMASHPGRNGEENGQARLWPSKTDHISSPRSSRPLFTAVTGLGKLITASVTAVTCPLGVRHVFFSKFDVPSPIYVISLFDKLPYDMYNCS